MRLEATNVSFSYGNKAILRDVSLAVEQGEHVGLIGPSGCGKSTLSKLLSGYLKPDAGEILWNGRPLPQKGYCPVQMIYQHPEKAVNPMWRLQKTVNEAWTPDQAFLDAMGIEQAWLRRWPNELSGGELQRFCIARALGPQTQFIIADEMTTMLDVITQAQIWKLLLDVVDQRGLGLMVVTHNMALAKRVCSRIIKFDELNHCEYSSKR